MGDFQKKVDRINTRSVKWDLTEKIFKDKEVLPMWVADMDFPAPKEVQQAIINRAQHNLYGYTITDNTLNEAITYWMQKRHNWKIAPEWITYSPGVVTSLHMIVQALTKEADKILIQTPIYPPFYAAVENHGRKVVKNPLLLNGDKYEIDFTDFEQKIKDKDLTMFILCNPHNPVGRVWTREELTKMAQICMRHNVLIVSDEIHSDLIFSSHKHIPIATISDQIGENVITCHSPSKTFNLAGLQASYIITTDRRKKLKIDNQLMNQGFHLLNTFGITAMEAAYKHGEKWLHRLIEILEENKRYVIETIHSHTRKIKVFDSEGTYLLWIDCRELGLEPQELKQFFRTKAKIGLNDGYTFGKEGEGFMRINIACPKEIVVEGVNRILGAL
ncbi:cystathionine beta-lyase [Salirhabdus euzebyi]|uniref:cysteine-S-conjugate beta-lyase n=1 Tax=Salirhabdus euzebyi TaxID=394506 RepID=A0A841Q4U6_9BACI|nr:MalY/PatB family protein [Salirhabdus euzebyi]MBB6453415.1 cystathionine beta-lyase [Salirhabdus euzebyi]